MKHDFNKIKIDIANMCNVNKEKIIKICLLKKGMTNNSYLFSLNNIEYIYRIPGLGTDKFINRKHEYNNYVVTKSLHITDELIFYDIFTGIKISKYEKETSEIDINSELHLKKCIDILVKLHNSNIKVTYTFNIKEKILFYKNLYKDSKIKSKYYVLNKKMNELFVILDSQKKTVAFSHIDAICDNFLLLKNQEIKLIDWEYAMMCDPLIDISMFALYSNFTNVQLEEFMKLYFVDKPTDNERLRIYLYMALGGFLWGLWAIYKESLGIKMEDYKKSMFSYASNYYDKCKNLVK